MDNQYISPDFYSTRNRMDYKVSSVLSYIAITPIRKYLVILLFIFIFLPSISYAQSTGDYRSNGNVDFLTVANWQYYNGSAWVAATVPPGENDGTVTIMGGNTATVLSLSTIESLDVYGTVNFSNGSQLTVNGDVTVETGGTVNMPGGSGIATLIVYGNYTNYGISNFWKSNVIVTGNFISLNTSGVQAQGNIIVGGNIIGDINLTGEQVPIKYMFLILMQQSR